MYQAASVLLIFFKFASSYTLDCFFRPANITRLDNYNYQHALLFEFNVIMVVDLPLTIALAVLLHRYRGIE